MRRQEDRDTLAVAGVEKLHRANWKSVVNHITRLFEAHNSRHIELDLSEVGCIDNYGVGVLIALNRIAQQRKGNLRVKNPSLLARSILELTRMHRRIAIEDSETEPEVLAPTHSYHSLRPGSRSESTQFQPRSTSPVPRKTHSILPMIPTGLQSGIP